MMLSHLAAACWNTAAYSGGELPMSIRVMLKAPVAAAEATQAPSLLAYPLGQLLKSVQCIAAKGH
jgi:hypothetical protein